MAAETRLKYLFKKYNEHTCTPAEQAELLSLLRQAEHDENLKELIAEVLSEEQVSHHLSETNAEAILEAILSAAPVAPAPPAPHYEKAPGKTPFLFGWKRAAAAVILLAAIGGGIYTWQASPKTETGKIAPRLEASQQILPGQDRAVLILEDGSVVDLETAEDSLLNARIGMPVQKEEGRLVYRASAQGRRKAIYNTIKTPRAGQYKVVLSDGTKVWLNAQSSLKFPTSFTGPERRVELNGEAYFEVAKNERQPFHVLSGDTDIEVLGTHFNVQSYQNEPAMETTLLEGSVAIRQQSGPTILSPGQQIRLSGTSRQVSEVDTNNVVAWKNGVFQFSNADLKSIMRQLERWYDVQIDYESIPHKRYNGTVLRNSNLSEVLMMLEMAGRIRFEVKNRTVRVIETKDNKTQKDRI